MSRTLQCFGMSMQRLCRFSGRSDCDVVALAQGDIRAGNDRGRHSDQFELSLVFLQFILIEVGGKEENLEGWSEERCGPRTRKYEYQ